MRDYKVVDKNGIVFNSSEEWVSEVKRLRSELNKVLDHYEIRTMAEHNSWYCYGSPPEDVVMELNFQQLLKEELPKYQNPILKLEEIPVNTYVIKHIV